MKDINLSAIQVIMAIEILHQSETVYMKEIVVAMIDGWNILNRIDESTQVRFLLDGILCEFGTTFIQNLSLSTNSEGYNILHTLCKKGDLDLLMHFLATVNEQNTDDILKMLITAKTKDGSNFLHVICMNEIEDTNKFDTFLDCIRKYLDHQTLTDLMSETTNKNLNMLLTCSRYQPVLKFLEVVDIVLKKFNHEDCKNWLLATDLEGNNFALQVAKVNGPAKIELLLTKIVWKLENILSFEEILCPKDGAQTSLIHYLSTKNLASFFDTLQMKELAGQLAEKIFLMKNAQHKTVLELVFLDAITFQKTVLILMGRYGKKLVTQVLTVPDQNGESAVTRILRKNPIHPMYDLFDWLDKTLPKDFYDGMLKKVCIYAASRCKPKKSTKIVLSWMANQQEQQTSFAENLEQKALFLRVYCPSNDSLVLVDLFIWLCSYFDRSEIKKLLFSKDHNQSFLQILQEETVDIEFLCFLKWLITEFDCYKKVLKVMETDDDPTITNDIEDSLELVKFLTNEFDEQFFNELFEYEDYRFVNILSKYNYKIEFLDLIKWLTFQFGKDELKNFLLGDHIVGEAFFFHSIIRNCVKVDFVEMIKWLKEQFGETFTMKMMLIREQSYTFLHLLARFIIGFDFLKLFKLLIVEFKKSDLKTLLIAKNSNEFSFLHFICRYHEEVDLLEIFKWLLKEFKKDFISELLSAVDGDGNRFEHLLSHHNKKTNIVEVLNLLSRELSSNFIEDLLIFQNSENLNFLQCLSAHSHKIEITGLIVSLISNHKEFFKGYLLTEQNTEQTFLHLLCKNNFETNILALLQYLTLQFGHSWMTDLLIVQDNNNHTFLHLLCRYNDTIPLLKLLMWISTNFDKEFVKELLLLRDAENQNFLKALQKQKSQINIFDLLKWMKAELGNDFQRKMLLP